MEGVVGANAHDNGTGGAGHLRHDFGGPTT